MPDTGAPWNIPYVESTDLVSDWPADSLALANAIDSALDIANTSGGLISVKSATFTGTQTASVAAGGNTAITSLSISHAVDDAANKVILMGFLGFGANAQAQRSIGFGFAVNGSLIGVGDSGARAEVTGAAYAYPSSSNLHGNNIAANWVYTPGDTLSKTYTMRAINVDNSTRAIYVNRSPGDSGSTAFPRSASGLVLLEVSV